MTEILIICMIIGFFRGGYVLKQTHNGNIPGTTEKKTFFDWMFYNDV